MNIAILGAESTGKTQLAHQLAAHFAALGQRAVAVDEYLREWCDAQQRTPQSHEQQHIAREQQRRIEAARLNHSHVMADTTPLMTAIYSDFFFQDTSLHTHAVQFQKNFDLTLLTGLDMPWEPDGLQRDGPQVREPVDALLRTALDSAGIAYRVVYGTGDARLMNASNAINSIAAHAGIYSSKSQSASKPWVWMCDKCSDPDCEHRLFSALTLAIASSAQPVDGLVER
jgi:nicotinamide riboside kinase